MNGLERFTVVYWRGVNRMLLRDIYEQNHYAFVKPPKMLPMLITSLQILQNLLAMYFESLKRLNGLMKEFRMSLGEER